MLPIVTIPETIRTGMAPYRKAFCREAGLDQVGRYVTGLILSPNKTLPEIYDAQVWTDGAQPSRRAMHAAVFEAGWDVAGLLPQHRAVVAPAHRGRGREVVCVDWTSAHHERGPYIWGVKRRWDHVEKRQSLYQTVLTAVVANRELIDGIDVVVQPPTFAEEEVAAALRTEYPESFRGLEVRCRTGETKPFWAFTKVVRLKRYGRKRLVIVHEQADLSDEPRFLLTDAQHWESGRVIETWRYRWAAEIFHEVSKQVTGLEAAQVRKEEAVTRHFRLRSVAQSLLQRAPDSGRKSERVAFAQGHNTVGQRVRTIARDALYGLLKLVAQLFAQGHSSGCSAG